MVNLKTEIFLASFGSLIFTIPSLSNLTSFFHLTGWPRIAWNWIVWIVALTPVRFSNGITSVMFSSGIVMFSTGFSGTSVIFSIGSSTTSKVSVII